MEIAYKLKDIRAKLSKNKIFYHFLFWIVFILYSGLIDIAFNSDSNINWFGYSLGISLFYTVNLFIMPQFFEKKRYLSGIFALLTLFTIYCLLMLIILHFQTNSSDFASYFNTDKEELYFSIFNSLNNFITYMSYGTIFWVFGFIKRQYADKTRIENESYAVEKDFLNRQINQHFLYNMLNLFYVKANNYSESLANDILSFSELLRYSLKDNDKEWVLLVDEVEEVKRMTHLYDNKIDFFKSSFKIRNLPTQLRIPSNMLLLVYKILLINNNFIENDFMVSMNYIDEKITLKISCTYKSNDFKIDFSILKDRLVFILKDETNLKEVQIGKRFELTIVIFK